MMPQSAYEALPSLTAEAQAEDEIRNLAWFRYNLRKFLRFSEKLHDSAELPRNSIN